MAAQVALGVIAAELLEFVKLRVGLDALADDGQAEGAAHLDDRPHDRNILRVAAQAIDERAIDLHRAQGESPQIAKRGVARAKVVEHERQPVRVQLVEDVKRGLGYIWPDLLKSVHPL